MKTKIEQIENFPELITYITAFGIPTDVERVVKMQDIVGHTAIEEIAKFANDDGTKTDENGHKWSTGSRGTQAETMSLLFHIWHWEDATRFYNEYVNPITKKMREDTTAARKEAKAAKEKAEKDTDIINGLSEKAEAAEQEIEEIKTELEEAQKELKEKEHEILKLKAMLFDYMTK